VRTCVCTRVVAPKYASLYAAFSFTRSGKMWIKGGKVLTSPIMKRAAIADCKCAAGVHALNE